MASLRHRFEEPGDVQDIRLVVDAIPALAWSAGPDGSADFFNQRWLDYTGLSAEQALGSGWQVAIHPHDLNDLVDYWRRVVASGQPGEIEGRLRRSDGVYGWFLFRATPSLDENGRVVKWYGTNTDIDDRKRAEQVLAVQNTRLQLLLQLTKRITSNLELREVLRSVSATVRKAMHADAAGVAFFDEVSDKCRIYALDFPDAKGFVKEEIVVTPGLAFKRAWESSKPVIVNTNDPEELGPEIYALRSRKNTKKSYGTSAVVGAIWWASRARQVTTCERFRTGWRKSTPHSVEFVSCIQPAEPSDGRLFVGSWNRSLLWPASRSSLSQSTLPLKTTTPFFGSCSTSIRRLLS